jgi:hypothetical protein
MSFFGSKSTRPLIVGMILDLLSYKGWRAIDVLTEVLLKQVILASGLLGVELELLTKRRGGH